MPYPKRLLQSDESLVVDLKPHWWFFAKQIFVGIPLFVLIVVVALALDGGTVKDIALWGWVAGAVVYVVWLGIKFLNWNYTYFVVTTERVIYRSGIISKTGVEIPLSRINNINFKQTIWERVIGAGDLDIESAGESGQSTFEDVRHPDGVQQAIYRAMEDNERHRASWSAPVVQQAPAAPSISDQIEQLARLRDQGHITPEEFEAKKQDLLGRM